MNSFQNPYNPYNPYNNPYMPNRLPTYEVIKVNGKPGVDAFQMGPNSSVLLLDETANLVWLAQTDGAGYKTATPFVLSPYQEKPPVDVNALSDRLSAMEAELKEMREAYVKSNPAGNAKQQRNGNSAKPTNQS